MSTSSILLVEDHQAYASTLMSVLNKEENPHIVAVVDTIEKAMEKLAELQIDLVLVDISLPRVNGIDLMAEIRKQYPDLRCVMLSGHLSPEYVRRALDAGARGYLLKDDLAGILAGIQQVFKGGIYVSKELGDLPPSP